LVHYLKSLIMEIRKYLMKKYLRKLPQKLSGCTEVSDAVASTFKCFVTTNYIEPVAKSFSKITINKYPIHASSKK